MHYATSQKPPKKNEIKREHLPCSIPAHALSKLPKRASQRAAPLFASYIVGTFCTFMPIAGTRALCTYVGLSCFLISQRERLERRETDNKDLETGFGAFFFGEKEIIEISHRNCFCKIKSRALNTDARFLQVLSLAQLWSPWEGRRETG